MPSDSDRGADWTGAEIYAADEMHEMKSDRQAATTFP